MPLRSIKKIFTSTLIVIITIWFVESQMVYFDQIEKPRFDSHFGVAFETHNIKWF
jgi:PiT family inorganic phosphate transporter